WQRPASPTARGATSTDSTFRTRCCGSATSGRQAWEPCHARRGRTRCTGRCSKPPAAPTTCTAPPGKRSDPVAKVLMFIDHDITVRHFVLNGVLRALEDEHDVVWIFPERHRRVSGSPADLPIGRCRTVPISETRLHDYRRLYHASVLRMLRGTRDQRAMFAFW